ncbi:hypothetical protein PV518_33845 [Streptomyces sp. ND04-05B]|nr:hypothetical protein [Streptomyces sp. ND04-05B]
MEVGTGVLVHSRRDRAFASGTWLLAAAQDMAQATAAWAKRNGIALVRCGGIFGAIRIEAALVHAAAGTKDNAEVDAFLVEALNGAPVFMDQHSRWYYVLVPVSTGRRQEWRNGRFAPKAEFLGIDSVLGVPRPDATPEERSYWCVPMDGPGILAVPDMVSQLVSIGRLRQVEAERAADEPEGTPPSTFRA